jgi:hypothetical protein
MPIREPLGQRLEAHLERATAPVASPPPHVPAVLALQRTVGNHAMAALLGGPRAPGNRLARKPEDWRTAPAVQAVVSLTRGWNPLVTRWPPIVDATRSYMALGQADRAERRTVLQRLERAIDEWEQHQQSVAEGEAERNKKTALKALKELIAKERQDLDASLGSSSITSSSSVGSSEASAPSIKTGPSSDIRPGARDIRGKQPALALPVPPDRRRTARGDPFTPRTAQGLTDLFNRTLPPGETVSIAEVKRRVRDALMSSAGMNVWEFFPGRERSVEVPNLGTIRFYIHVTREPYLQGVHALGLIPGEQQGIGTPEGGSRDTANTYVVDPNNRDAALTLTSVTGDVTQAAMVFVVTASTQPQPDSRYGGGGKGAGYFPGRARAVRDAGRLQNTRVFSFTLVPPEPLPSSAPTAESGRPPYTGPLVGSAPTSLVTPPPPDGHETSEDTEGEEPSAEPAPKPFGGFFTFEDDE